MKLPAELGGVRVSPLAYQLVIDGYNGKDMTPAVVAARHWQDEADVLRAMAELVRKGVLEDVSANRGTEARV